MRRANGGVVCVSGRPVSSGSVGGYAAGICGVKMGICPRCLRMLVSEVWGFYCETATEARNWVYTAT